MTVTSPHDVTVEVKTFLLDAKATELAEVIKKYKLVCIDEADSRDSLKTGAAQASVSELSAQLTLTNSLLADLVKLQKMQMASGACV